MDILHLTGNKIIGLPIAFGNTCDSIEYRLKSRGFKKQQQQQQKERKKERKNDRKKERKKEW